MLQKSKSMLQSFETLSSSAEGTHFETTVARLSEYEMKHSHCIIRSDGIRSNFIVT
jgi:hypothetical protein